MGTPLLLLGLSVRVWANLMRSWAGGVVAMVTLGAPQAVTPCVQGEGGMPGSVCFLMTASPSDLSFSFAPCLRESLPLVNYL